MRDKTCFNSIDGLVLTAIVCQPDIDIRLWIGFIDCYYRMVLSYEEFNESFDKLQRSGMIIYENDKMKCTEKAQKLLTGRNRMGVLNWIFKVQERLEIIPFEDSCDVRFGISKESYTHQLNMYRASLK